MVVGRDLAAAVGALLIVAASWSVIGTVVVPRRIRSRLTRAVALCLNAAFHFVADGFDSYEPRDRILAAQAPIQLILQIVVWLGVFELGFALLFWPTMHTGGLASAFALAGSSLCTLGYLAPHGGGSTGLADIAALVGLGTVALQIGYLPTIYAAFNRREGLVTMLDSRAGVPSWGPELLARTHYGLGSGVSAMGQLPELFEDWERWSADVSESHATYLALLNFRSPDRSPRGSLRSWQYSMPPPSIFHSYPTPRGQCPPDCACGADSPVWEPSPVPGASPSPRKQIQTTASLSPSVNSSMPSIAWRAWIFHSNARMRRHGMTSWGGGSTTSPRPMPSPSPSMLRRPCGQGFDDTRSLPLRRCGRQRGRLKDRR